MSEKRSYPVEQLEIRSEEDGETIVGRIVPFDSWSQVMGDFQERFEAGAFGSLDGVDIRANVEHERTMTIARTPKTLKVEEREDGVWMTMQPAKTRAAQDAIELVRSGVIDGASIEFRVKERGDEWDLSEQPYKRTIRADGAMLEGFALTSWPVYTDTSAALRSLESWQQDHAPEPRKTKDVKRKRLEVAEREG